MKKYPIIAIEGIDGSGKTTISRLISEKLGFHYIKTPTKRLNSVRCFFDNSSTDPYARLHFYISCLWEAYNEATHSAKFKGVIFDRYIFSTQAYHSVLCNDPEKVNEIIRISAPPPADLNILLNIDVNIAAERIKNRNNLTTDNGLENNIEFQKKVAMKFESLTDFHVKLSKESTIQEIMDRIIKMIKV